MFRVVSWSARHHRLVIGLALLLAGAGELARRALARDVIPDLSDPQIALEGTAGAVAIRGSSMAGMAYVDVVFASPDQLEKGRAEILARVQRSRARLPANVRLQVGPVASSTGWVFQYVIVDPSRRQSLLALRRLQDDVLRPALSALAGVAEVASVGGAVQQVGIEMRSEALRARALAVSDVLSALSAASGLLPAATLEDLRALVLRASGVGDTPSRVGDVAYVRLSDDMPGGMADLGGVVQAVGGIVTLARDANLAPVIERVRRALDDQRARLPGGVQIIVVHDRLTLVDRVGKTLLRALGEEIAVVALVIAIFLFSGPSALVPLMTLPLVLLLTFGAMWMLGVTATIMSLGGIGIALGMAVDVDVVALEACHRRLERLGARGFEGDRRAELVAAAASFTPAILTSLVIAALTFLPVFAFTGETGRLLRPLALTKTLLIAAAALVTLTFAPALRDRMLRGRVRAEGENPLVQGLVRLYGPFVRFALDRPLLTLLTATLAVLSCLPVVRKLGGEFLPRVDEGDLLFMPTTLPGVSPDQAVMQLRWQDRAIASFGEVATVFGKVGRADTATDPAPYTMAETTIHLRPRSEWPQLPRRRWYSNLASPALRRALGLIWPERRASTTAELVERLDGATRLPGWTSAWTAPARARMDMMSTGLRTPVGVRIVAARPERLHALGVVVRDLLLSRVSGTRSAVFESLGGEVRLDMALDEQALVRQGVERALARSTADLFLRGGQIGEIGQQDGRGLPQDGRRLRLRVLVNAGAMGQGQGHLLADQVRGVTVRATQGGADAPVPLALLGHPTFVEAPSMLRTERGQLVGYVLADLTDGTDVRGYVQRARRALDAAALAHALPLGAGERIEWTGQADLLAAGEHRLAWIAPLVALSMLGLLFLQFRSLTEAFIVMASVPFALVGSIWALFLLGYSLSAPVWVGLLSVLGLAMQTGVVMVVYIDDAFHRRLRDGQIRTRDDIVEAHAEGTVRRLRPKVMTVTTMAAALLPLFWADGAGAEIMKRVAAPMIGGLVTSAFLTLEVLPVLYTIWRHRQLRRAERSGVPIEIVVGPPPPWARR